MKKTIFLIFAINLLLFGDDKFYINDDFKKDEIPLSNFTNLHSYSTTTSKNSSNFSQNSLNQNNSKLFLYNQKDEKIAPPEYKKGILDEIFGDNVEIGGYIRFRFDKDI